jgi:hypothetical protein
MKVKIFLFIWFVLVFLVAGVVLAPLHFWQSSLNQALTEEGVHLEQFEGRFWQGKAKLRVNQLRGEVLIQWKLNGVFEPIDFQVLHKEIKAWGSFQPEVDEVSLWIDGLSLSSELLNSFLEPYKAKVSGGNIVLEKLYGKWPYVESTPSKLRGNGYWEGGDLEFVVSRQKDSVFLDKVLFELININSINQLKVTSLKGVPLINAGVSSQGDAELSVMPAVFELINQPWTGDMDVPAFVMTDKVF